MDNAKSMPEHDSYVQKSFYSKMVEEQYKMQPKYCEPGEAGGGLKGPHSNKQVGP